MDGMNMQRGTVASNSDPRTYTCRHLADALVVEIGHKHVAARIDGHGSGPIETGVGPSRIEI